MVNTIKLLVIITCRVNDMLRMFSDRYCSAIEMVTFRTSGDDSKVSQKSQRQSEQTFSCKKTDKFSCIRQNKMLFNLGFVRLMKILNTVINLLYDSLGVVPGPAKLTSPRNISKYNIQGLPRRIEVETQEMGQKSVLNNSSK